MRRTNDPDRTAFFIFFKVSKLHRCVLSDILVKQYQLVSAWLISRQLCSFHCTPALLSYGASLISTRIVRNRTVFDTNRRHGDCLGIQKFLHRMVSVRNDVLIDRDQFIKGISHYKALQSSDICPSGSLFTFAFEAF